MAPRPFIRHPESALRAGETTTLTFGDFVLWLYFEATTDGPRFAVELWQGNQKISKNYHVYYADALKAFDDTHIKHAVSVAMSAFDIPRSTLH